MALCYHSHFVLYYSHIISFRTIALSIAMASGLIVALVAYLFRLPYRSVSVTMVKLRA